MLPPSPSIVYGWNFTKPSCNFPASCSQIQILPCPISGSYHCLMPQVTSSQPVFRTSAQSTFLDCFLPSQNVVSRMFSLSLSSYCHGSLDCFFFFLHFLPSVVGCYCQIHSWNGKLGSGKSCRLTSEHSDSNSGRKFVLMLWSLTLWAFGN